MIGWSSWLGRCSGVEESQDHPKGMFRKACNKDEEYFEYFTPHYTPGKRKPDQISNPVLDVSG